VRDEPGGAVDSGVDALAHGAEDEALPGSRREGPGQHTPPDLPVEPGAVAVPRAGDDDHSGRAGRPDVPAPDLHAGGRRHPAGDLGMDEGLLDELLAGDTEHVTGEVLFFHAVVEDGVEERRA
jgi:hypothetical protein